MRQGNSLFQNLAYSYDQVGNVLGLQNNVPVPPANTYGGPTNQTFAYDDLYRLTHAQGTYQFSPSKTHSRDVRERHQRPYRRMASQPYQW